MRFIRGLLVVWFFKLILVGLVWIDAPEVVADTISDLPKLSSFRICTQNLFRYGEKRGKKTTQQRSYLVDRIVSAQCDVIAVQEVYGKDKRSAKRKLLSLRKELEKETGVEYGVFVGDGFDPYIRNGYLYRVQAAKVIFFRSIHDDVLPKLQPLGPNEKHMRDPLLLALSFELETEKEVTPVTLLLVNFHLKSKYKGFEDPSGTSFEITRMEAADGVRRTLMQEADKLSRMSPKVEVLPVMLGDRNCNVENACAKIMLGEMILDDFKRGGNCRLDASNDPVCQSSPVGSPQRFVGMLELYNQLSHWHFLYTYQYHGNREIIDEIAVLSTGLEYFLENKKPRVGVLGNFYQGSDHHLVWAEVRAK